MENEASAGDIKRLLLACLGLWITCLVGILISPHARLLAAVIGGHSNGFLHRCGY